MNPVELPTAEIAVEELLERSAERGFVLLSELQELYVPELHGQTWIDDAITSARDAGVQVIDDVADDAPEALADPTAALTTDLVRQYLNDAGRHALLTKEDEADLAKRYQAGLAADEMLREKAGPLARARKARLRTVSRDGAKAKERMVQANLRLVVPQARKFSGRDLDFIELIQEGNLGLLRAVEKFDHTKGYKFSTYAVWWIRQALQRGVASKGRTIRVPAHVWELYGKLRSAELRLRQQKGGDPTEEEIAAEVGLTATRVREVREAMQELVSLDRPIGEDGDATMGDLIADHGVVDPADTALEGDAMSQIEAALDALDDRERIILVLRFGLGGEEPQTLEEIGAHFGLTRERIRQMQNRALAKLRHPSRAHNLSGLLDVLDRAA
ncbi:sigma-70 family RNA polymerase sigma factor [Nitriliruptor alkaliphilus]|uniref:sigma-70 family RNA polymerase sigma factor n=1 Tax=Nitriliruptor alkaliphilus TaxID=427918 RepID=UPI000B277C4C|nr:sigma-70 family RNA polymerase sigma factor [Nitriliruptor alkaliphilus]